MTIKYLAQWVSFADPPQSIFCTAARKIWKHKLDLGNCSPKTPPKDSHCSKHKIQTPHCGSRGAGDPVTSSWATLALAQKILATQAPQPLQGSCIRTHVVVFLLLRALSFAFFLPAACPQAFSQQTFHTLRSQLKCHHLEGLP